MATGRKTARTTGSKMRKGSGKEEEEEEGEFNM